MAEEEKVEAVARTIKTFFDGGQFLKVSFRKKDGTMRTMLCHRSKILEHSVKGTMRATTEKIRETRKQRGLMLVEEIVCPGKPEHQWRTVNLATVVAVEGGGQLFTFES